MRLPTPNDFTQSQLEEFDVWITPSLGEIVDTDRFKEEMALVSDAFETLGRATSEFESEESCHPGRIGEVLAHILNDEDLRRRGAVLSAVASTLFAVTGKSDNNFKCQFPVYLRDHASPDELRTYRMGRRAAAVAGAAPIPRTISSRQFMSTLVNLSDIDIQVRLLNRFIAFILKDDRVVRQLWALGYSYFAMKKFGRQLDLLAPIVAFKIRGSVMASGGHEPERLLRVLLEDWGLRPDVDFNTADVVVEGTHDGRKTRAYDFILPYKTPGWPEDWGHRLFIQCQFYAGDSGSVSHKNVDQTRSSRDEVKRLVHDPRFIEYVDGAGYFSSLNGDLRRLLAYEDTHGLIQIRTAPVRLRAYFDEIGFLSPLKLEQTVALGAKSRPQIGQRLEKEGFRANEIERVIEDCLDRALLVQSGRGVALASERRDIVRRYLLLDCAVHNAAPLDREHLAGKVLVPGYGPFHGVGLDRLAQALMELDSLFSAEYEHSPTLLADIRQLAEEGCVMGR